MDLFLLSEEEKKALDSDLLIEPITFETKDDILSRLYNPNFEKIMITRRYIDIIGADKVLNAVIALNKLSYKFSTSIFLLNHQEEIIDDVLSRFSNIGVKIVNVNASMLTYAEYNNIPIMQRVDTSQYSEAAITENVLQIVNELKEVSSEDLEEYLKFNYVRVISAIVECEQILNSYKTLQDETLALRGAKEQLEETVKYYTDRYNYEKYRNSELKHSKDMALQLIQKYSASIRKYNSTIAKTNLHEEYIYCSKDRNTIVIYMKELEDIGFFKLFEVLFDSLFETYNLRAKAVVLENDSRRYFNPYKNYMILSQNPKMNDIVLNDRLVIYGNARKVLEVLTRNQLQIQFLLVYDRTYNPNVCLQLENEYTFYIGNKRENYFNLGLEIPDSNFISPFEGDYTDISHLYRDTDNMPDTAFRIYCNHTYFFKELIKLCIQLSKKRD